MGKITGFMDYERCTSEELPPLQRIENYDEFHIPMTPAEQQKQGARCMDCGVPFCQSGQGDNGLGTGCPLNNLIPEWNELVFEGNWELAFYRLSATNRFPEFTSRVCPALCEAACVCGHATGNSVTVRENEHTIVEMAYEKGWRKVEPIPARTGKNVAVVGSGPAGLAVAEWLNKRGHTVTVYERSDRPGGLLMYGIPNMKLGKKVIMRRIKIMQDEGVKFVLNADVGNTVSVEQLRRENDAVVLCCGAGKARDIQAPGRDALGVMMAVDYLTSVTKSMLDSQFTDGRPFDVKGRHVLVIGGGDTGNDCVATAIRQGCSGVTQLVKRPQPPKERTNLWPEWPNALKVDYGQAEAIAKFGADPRRYLSAVKEFVKDENGCLRAVVINKLGPVTDSGTGRTVYAPTGETETIECSLALIAQGFLGCEDYVTEAFGVEVNKRGNVADHGFATNVPGVFVCGDMRRGSSLVVWALREGRDAAREVDAALMGYSNL